jgi:hypothetical protein
MSAVKFNTRWITAVVLSTCVASASSAATLEVEPGSSLYYSDEGKGTPILFVPGWIMTFALATCFASTNATTTWAYRWA